MNSAGTALVAWLEPAEPGELLLRARMRRFGGEWAPPAEVARLAATAERVVRAAVDPHGNALLAWYEADAQRIRTAVRSAATGAWGSPQTVASAPPTPSLGAALGPDGTALVAWSGRDPLAPQPLRAALRPAALGAWAAPETVAAPEDRPQLAGLRINPAGTAAAFWWAGEQPPLPLRRTSLRPPGGPWSAPETLPATPPTTANQIAIGPDGGLLAVGSRGRDGSAFRPVAAERPPAGPWGPFEEVPRGGLGERVGLSSVAVDGAGNAVALGSRLAERRPPARPGVVWQTVVAERPASGSWGPLRLVSDENRAGTGGALALGEGGAAVALWSRGGARPGLRASYRPAPGAGWSAPEEVVPLTEAIDFSAVHADASGRALAVWVGGDRLQSAERIAGAPATVRLSAAQLRINQRVAQAAVRRANALIARLEAGISGADLRPGALLPGAFSAGVVTSGSDSGALPAPRARRPLRAAAPSRGGTVLLSAAQLRVNQRIGQTAVRRANGIAALLDSGLTGGNVVDGTIGPDALAPGISIDATSPEASPLPARIEVAPPRRDRGRRVTLTAQQLLINQRIYQAAIRRLNALAERLEGGLSGADLRPGTITEADLTAELRR